MRPEKGSERGQISDPKATSNEVPSLKNRIEKTIKITTGKAWKQSREAAIVSIMQALHTVNKDDQNAESR